jgi:hypothetical protein
MQKLTSDSHPDEIMTEPSGARGKGRTTSTTSSIHYAGAKEPRVPIPVVIVGLVVAAAAIYSALHYLHS